MPAHRDYFFDNAKFILIVLVVIGHALEGVQSPLVGYFYQLIYLFHMPCFIFILGYFSKNIKKERIIYNFFIYLTFQTIYCIFNILVLGKNISSISFITPIWILWFMLAAAVWQFLFYKSKNKEYLILLSFLIALIVGYIKFIGYSFSLSRIIVFAPFFLIGYYMENNIFIKVKKINIFISLFLISCLLIIIVAVEPFDTRLLYGSMAYSRLGLKEWYAFAYRLLYYIFSLTLSVCFFSLIPQKEHWITQFGSRTLQVYLLHGLIILYTKHIGLPGLINSYLEMLVYLLVISVMVILLSSKPVKSIIDCLLFPLGKLAEKISNTYLSKY